MEWQDFNDLILEDPFYGLSSQQLQIEQNPGWTTEENQLFGNALAEIDPSSPGFFELLASRLPWRSIAEIKSHYQALDEEFQMIQASQLPFPNHEEIGHIEPKDDESEDDGINIETEEMNDAGEDQPRRRGLPWTEEEHQLFLMGLNKYGKGEWTNISRNYVISKTPTQVASHAQKYFKRQASLTSPEKRRPSIHDIKTVSSTTLNRATSVPSFGQFNINLLNNSLPIIRELFPSPGHSSSSPYLELLPLFDDNINNNLFNDHSVINDISTDPNPFFAPINSSFPPEIAMTANPMMTHQLAGPMYFPPQDLHAVFLSDESKLEFLSYSRRACQNYTSTL